MSTEPPRLLGKFIQPTTYKFVDGEQWQISHPDSEIVECPKCFIAIASDRLDFHRAAYCPVKPDHFIEFKGIN